MPATGSSLPTGSKSTTRRLAGVPPTITMATSVWTGSSSSSRPSLQKRFTEGAGDKFDVTIKPLPIAADDKSKVYFPTGGSAIVMLTKDDARQKAAWEYIAFVTGPEGQKIIVENTGYAPANAKVIEDKSYLGDFYANNPNALVAHSQVANFAGPWYAYPGAEGVAATDLIAASLVEVAEGADPDSTIKDLAETLRGLLGMK